MSRSCRSFRAHLADALQGRPVDGLPPELSWHEHLRACGECRALLEAEEALEAVLATLPAPRLPRGLAERVLARLDAVRADGLDRLLELDRTEAEEPDEQFATRVLAGLSVARQEAALDRLLDGVPEPDVPADLSERVLAGLAAERRPPFVLLARRFVGYAAAAAVLLGLGFGAWWTTQPDEEMHTIEPLAAAGVELDAVELELIRNLDLLENWELLTSDELEVELASEFDSFEVELFEMDGDESDLVEPATVEEKRG